jgi:hypothetical protein
VSLVTSGSCFLNPVASRLLSTPSGYDVIAVFYGRRLIESLSSSPSPPFIASVNLSNETDARTRIMLEKVGKGVRASIPPSSLNEVSGIMSRR